MNNQKDLSIVIPSYNESENLKKGSLAKIADYLGNKNLAWEVLIIDDGSSDNSCELVEQFTKNHSNFKLVKNLHQGKAATVLSGLGMAQGEIVVFTDMDQATPVSEFDKFSTYFNQGYDIVIGSRATNRQGAPLLRQIMATGFAIIRTMILGLNLTDTQCGFKAFTNKAAHTISELLLSRWQKVIRGAAVNAGFDVELLFMAQKLGFKIAEVPVAWHYVGTKRISPIKDSIQAVADMLRIKIEDVQGVYDQYTSKI